jgi:hypothetical protein
MAMIPIKYIGKGAGYVLMTAVGVVLEKYASKRFEKLNDYAISQGGYKNVAKRQLKAAEINTRRALHHAGRTLDERVDVLGEKLEPVIEDMKERLGPVVDDVKKKSKTVYNDVSDVISKCRKKLEDKWYDYFPREEDLNVGGMYERIGSAYKSVYLTRTDCENCLRFIESAKRRIPDNEKLKQSVILDIRHSASYDYNSLERFYQSGFFWNMSNTDALGIIMDSVAVAEKFLKQTENKFTQKNFSFDEEVDEE